MWRTLQMITGVLLGLLISLQGHSQAIQSFSPTAVCPGAQLTVAISGFSAKPVVKILGNAVVTVPANSISYNGNSTLALLQFAVPANATTGKIAVSLGSNADTSGNDLTIFSVPTANPGSNKTVCPGNNTTLGTTGSGLSYQWSPAFGLNNDNNAQPTFNSTAPGSYVYSLVVTNSDGCASAPAAVTVTVTAPPTGISILGDSLVCNGDQVAYNPAGGQNGYTYAWATTGGSPASGNGSNFTVTWNNPPGPKQVRVTPSTSNGCAGVQVVKSVSLQSPPNVSITSPVVTTYATADNSVVPLVGSPTGGTFSVLTTNPAAPAGLLSNNSLNLAVINSQGNFQIQYTYTDPGTGCEGKDTLFLQIYDPGGAVCGLPASICLTANDTVIILNKDQNCQISTIFPGATLTDMFVYGPGVTQIGSGVYQFDPRAIGGAGSVVISALYYQYFPVFNVFSASQLIQIYEPAAPIAPDPAPVCQGTAAPVLTASGGNSANYLWSLNADLSNATTATTFTPTTLIPGLNTIYVAYNDANGCRSLIDSVLVTVTSAPTSPTVPASLISACPAPILPPLIANPGISLRWYSSDPSNGITFPIGFGAQIAPSISAPGSSQTYYVTDVLGACESAPTAVQYSINPLLSPAFTGLGAAYCNPPSTNPIILTGTAAVSIEMEQYSGPGITNGVGSFDVALAGNGTHAVQYLVEDALGCRDSVTKFVTVTPKPQVSFTGLDPTYCQQEGQQVVLRGVILPGVVSAIFEIDTARNGFTLVANPNTQSGLATFSPENAFLGVNTITYYYLDQNGCRDTISLSTRVFPQPKAQYKTLGACQDSSVTFQNRTTFVGNVAGTLSSVKWRFGDGDTSLVSSPTHVYGFAGAYNVTLEVATDSGCVDQLQRNLIIESNPVVDFSWKNICLGDVTAFSDASVQAVGNIRRYNWNFGDGRTSTLRNPNHSYFNSGSYQATLTATSDSGCFAMDTQRVFILNKIDLSGPGDPYYYEDFENGDGSWIPEGTIAGAEGWSWALGNPNPNGTINAPAEGQFSWKTNLNGPYPASEISFLNSPCFDLSGLTRPMIALQTWTNTNPQNDGAVLQFSLNNGVSWATLGKKGTGIGWFDRENILSTPGTSQSNPFRFGWADDTQTFWKESRHKLDELLPGSKVRFRVGFSSLGVVDSTKDGFALDSVWIGNRTKNLLVEYFAHTGDIGSYNSASNYIYALGDANPRDLNVIQYHLDNAGGDYWHDLLPEPPNARSLYYKIPQETYRAVLDGNRENVFATDLPQLSLDLRMLETPLFTVLPPTFVQNTAGRLDSIKVNLTSKAAVNEDLVIQIALISREFFPQNNVNNSPFRYQLVNMFPNAGGTLFSSWSNGQTRTVSVKATTPLNSLQFQDSFAVVAFVQNLQTGEVYQTASALVPQGTYVTAVEKALPAYLQSVKLFPNPANDLLFCQLAQSAPSALNWSLTDLAGKVVLKGEVLPGQMEQQISVGHLAAGMYQFQLSAPDQAGRLTQKVLVTH